MKEIGTKKVVFSKLKVPVAVAILSMLLLSLSVSTVASGQTNTQSTGQYSYPFSVINSTMSVGTNGNSYQLKIGMDDAQDISLAQFTVNMTHPFYGAGGVSSEQINKTNVNTGTYFTLTYPIYAFNNASKGNYTFTLYIHYWVSFPYGTNPVANNQNFNLNLTFLGTSLVGITASGTSLYAGNTTNLPLSIKNGGTGSITNPKVSETSQAAITFTKPFPTIGSVSPGGYYNFTEPVFISVGTSGVISVNFTINFYNPYGTLSSTSNVTTFSVQPLLTSINVTTSTELLNSGKTNNVSFIFKNSGNANLSNIESQVSSQSQLSFLEQFPTISSLNVGQSFAWNEPIYVSSTVSGAVTVDFTESFTTPSGTQSSVQLSSGFHTQQPNTSENVSLVVKMNSPYVVLGINSSAVLDIANIGNTTLYSPVISISAPAGFMVTGNSTFYYPNVSLLPSESISVPIELSSSPSTAQGAYAVSISIEYYNSTGTVITKSFEAGFLGVAKVALIIQGFSENTSASTVTVSGTLLDEGTGSAYYLTLNATFAQRNLSSTGSTYIGEVDSNTPTPFSLTFNLPSGATNGTAYFSILVSYQNYYGEMINSSLLNHSTAYRTSTTPVNQTTTPTKRLNPYPGLGLAILLVIIVVVIVLVLVLRNRGRDKKKVKK